MKLRLELLILIIYRNIGGWPIPASWQEVVRLRWLGIAPSSYLAIWPLRILAGAPSLVLDKPTLPQVSCLYLNWRKHIFFGLILNHLYCQLFNFPIGIIQLNLSLFNLDHIIYLNLLFLFFCPFPELINLLLKTLCLLLGLLFTEHWLEFIFELFQESFQFYFRLFRKVF